MSMAGASSFSGEDLVAEVPVEPHELRGPN